MTPAKTVPSWNSRSKRPRYARTANIKKNAARLSDKPRQSLACAAETRRCVKKRAPPVTATNTAAITQAITDSVSRQHHLADRTSDLISIDVAAIAQTITDSIISHPVMSCAAGSVNR